jgi:(p)ppGpp synthase/HD superfamily hydrolase
MKGLDDAIALAANAHINQFDKGGKPYILHPLRVMHKVMKMTDDENIHMLAVLHDVVEDTNVTLEYLEENAYPWEVIDALALMTKQKGESYIGTYIPRLCTNYGCILVKMSDIAHNSDISRLKGITEKDLDRMTKYQISHTMLADAKAVFERTF